MREIKFRAQNQHNPPDWVIFTLPMLMEWNDGSFDPFKKWKNWCEYTGLKDKVEKEIFEGDILRYEDGDLSEPAIYVVEFHSGCFMSIHQEDEEYNEFVNEFDSTTREIIGNIYENPELLKEKGK